MVKKSWLCEGSLTFNIVLLKLIGFWYQKEALYERRRSVIVLDA